MPKLARYCAVALIFLAPCSLVAADRQAVSCYRLGLQEAPDWITSGAAWDKDNQRLLMVDPVRDRVVSYNLLGEQEVIEKLGPELRPVKIVRSDDGFLLESVDGSMLSLDRDLEVTGRNLAAKMSPPSMASLYQWVASGRGSFAAFAALGRADREEVEYGFFRGQQTSKLQPLLSADKGQADFFLHGYPYITSAAGRTYFLSMAKHNGLYRVSDGKAEKLINALPRQYAARPDLKTPMTGPRDAPARYAELETLSIPAGLYAQEGFLYLLGREPAKGGNTTWWLYQIDPAGRGGVLGRVRLPTTANHLTVIPTPDQGWMFIERGKVEFDSSQRAQIQKVGPVVVVSNAAIRSLSMLTSCPVGGGILWANHHRGLFIPEPLVASRMVLPVELSSRKYLDLRLAGEPKSAKSASPCDFLEPSTGQGTLPNASSLKDLVASSQVAVVGKIVSTEPGWDARLRHVVTKVNLQVTHPLKGALNAGSTIDFLSPGGSMALADRRICTSPRRGFYQPRVGDEIVVAAETSAADSRLLESPYVFPLSEGMVQPEPYPALLAKQKPLSLSKLLDSSNKISSNKSTF